MRRLHALALAAGLALGAPASRAFAQEAPATDKLIADLGADDVNKRDEAQKKLESLGKKALPALEKAEKESQDAEVRARAHEAILSIKKARGEGETKPEKDVEREGPQLPPERRFAPRGAPRLPQQGEEPNFDELYKMFEGQDNDMMKVLPKIIEKLKKQMDGMDGEFEKELKRPRDNGRDNNRGRMRVYQFTARSKTPVEEKLGVLVNPPPAALQAQLDLGATDGALLVEELAPSGAAWKAGLKLYDVVLSVDGKAVRSADDLRGLGEKDAKVEIIRKAKKETLSVHAQAPSTEQPESPPEKKAEKKSDKDEPQIRKF